MVSPGAVRPLPPVTPLAFIDISLLVGFDVDNGAVIHPGNTGPSRLYSRNLQTGNVAVFARAGADHPKLTHRPGVGRGAHEGKWAHREVKWPHM